MSHSCVYVIHDENTEYKDLLAPFNENIKLDEPVLAYTKEQAIELAKNNGIGEYAKSCYDEYINDPEGYSNGCSKLHVEWVKNYPERLKWGDEEWYNSFIEGEDEELIKENGDVYTYYNPNARWDWYERGGRWSGTIPNDECKVGDFKDGKIDVPFAFVTPDGNWVERGEMGWFGCVSNDSSDEEWEAKFKEYFSTLDKNLVITQVDCHI